MVKGLETYDTLSGLMLYSFNMPLFFFVSGFLAYKVGFSVRGTFKNIWNKFVFLVIPAVIFFAFRAIKDGNSPLDLLSMGAGGYWFTITLWECFLLYYIFSLLVKYKTLRDIVLILVALAGVGFLSVFGDWGPKLLDLNRLTKYFQFFVIGVLAMKYKNTYILLTNNNWLKAVVLVVFFALLFTINSDYWPQPAFHLIRDVVLRYLGTFAVVSWFVCHSDTYNSDSRFNRLVLDIGKKSLPIYLLQYFFLPDFLTFTTFVEGLNGITMHLVSFTFAIVILAVCYVFISILSNSRIIKRYVLGLK